MGGISAVGDLRQGEALVEDGGQDPVGEGEDGAAAGAGGGQSRAVTAAGVQAGFPLLVVEGHQHGDQGVPVLGGQPGQGLAHGKPSTYLYAELPVRSSRLLPGSHECD